MTPAFGSSQRAGCSRIHSKLMLSPSGEVHSLGPARVYQRSKRPNRARNTSCHALFDRAVIPLLD